jgi:hypothetical protein
MLPEQLKYFYEILGIKNPPLTREEVAWTRHEPASSNWG